ncbi:helix-turn-helix domain-containing protein [Streptomyces sp. SCUT-3]|uniref:helix-turn-helix domain-containing protein n=1 Tax=Streptomyces TaxID=1883 RepID=UPI0015FA6CC6|nr:pyridoxamine 5'-phosphate oxidase family protein [Streptomyces sp. HB2AG]QMV24376.1 helix-turn-helix domain-containing protein [Streptomyces sp. SCUT-3]
MPARNPGDVGRRAAARRRQLGLTREEVARRAGMAPGYLQYLEEQPADPGTSGLTRLAGALGTTVAALHGGGRDLPPGTARAARGPRLVELTPQECRERLSTHGVGRVVVTTPAGTAVVPVNYSMVEGAVVYRTAPHAVPAAAAGTEAVFEVDHIDEALGRGWSVLVTGPAREVTDAAEARRLEERARSEPWAGGDRPMWVLIDPERVTGRLVEAG